LATAEPQYIRVRIEEHDETGSSIIPSAIADDAPIEARIQQARNTVNNVELWQELNREARTLSSLGVRSKDDTLTCPLTGTKTIVIDIVPLEESTNSPPHPSRSDDNIAEGISLALHLLLSYNHRLSRRRRTQPPLPLSAQKRPIPPAPLLRPLITRLAHQTNLSSIQGLLTPLSTILSSLGLTPLPTYTLSTPPPPPHLASLPPTEATTLSLIESITNTLTLTIHPSFTLTTTIRTTLFPPTTTFGLSVTPPSSPLNKTCKSPGILDTFPKTREYLLFATSCALAYLSTGPLAPGSSLAWEGTARPYVLRLVSSSGIDVGNAKQLAFSVDLLDEGDGRRGLEVTVAWERTSEVRGNSFEELAEEGAGTEQKVNKGEGWYKWFLKEGKVEGRGVAGVRGTWGTGEAVKGLREVVEIAAKA
jgi:mediator of RNA polymerase II transcription subunit 17